MRFLYSLLTYIALPFVLLRFGYRSRHYAVNKAHWLQRVGKFDLPDGAPCLWIHAVSVGETIAASAMVKALCQRYPDHQLLLTHMTFTGYAQSRRLFGKLTQVHTGYVPYDTPDIMARFLKRVRPRIAIMVETEWWPNGFYYCKQYGIPVMIANGRLSERSQKRYHYIARLTGRILRQVACYAAQSAADGNRVIALGLPSDRMHMAGNLKFDLPFDATWRIKGRDLRQNLNEKSGKSRPVWIAASTHEGEEACILEAHRLVHEAVPDAVLILVPRHPERFAPVAALSEQMGFRTVRRTQQDHSLTAEQSVFLGDTMGEMMVFYAASDVAFVGGSLAPIGGHNLLEPASMAMPILTGAHLHNFVAISQLLKEARALIIADNAIAIANQVIQWLQDPSLRKQVGQRAEHALHAHKGALARHLALIQKVLSTMD